jgi:hypothetical protein
MLCSDHRTPFVHDWVQNCPLDTPCQEFFALWLSVVLSILDTLARFRPLRTVYQPREARRWSLSTFVAKETRSRSSVWVPCNVVAHNHWINNMVSATKLFIVWHCESYITVSVSAITWRNGGSMMNLQSVTKQGVELWCDRACWWFSTLEVRSLLGCP